MIHVIGQCTRRFIRLRMSLTCKKLESVRLLCGVSQVAVWKTVGFFPGAVAEGRQSQVLDKQLL